MEMKNMTMEEFVRHAKQLRSTADTAELEFLEFLYQGEHHPKIWRDTGKTYLGFIADLCQPVRYANYKRVREGVGCEEMQGVGVHGVIAAGKLKSPSAQKDVLAQMRKFKETNGTDISAQSAARVVRDAAVRVAASVGNPSYVTLAERCERQQLRIRELETEVLALRAELRKYKSASKSSKVKKAS